MRRICTIILMLTGSYAFAQDSLKSFNNQRYQITTTGMEVLGSWGAANIAVGAAGWANSKGGENKSFYQMNLIWGVANVGAAILGYTGAQNNKDKKLNAEESLASQKKIEKIFLVNGGLDVVYIAAGAFLKHRGDTHNNAELKGYGSAIIIQGAFLLLFDGTMYGTHRSNGNKLSSFLEKNPIIFNGKSVGMVYHL
jgi:hypothetical protein